MLDRLRVPVVFLVAATLLFLSASCGEEGGEMAILDLEPRVGRLAGEQGVKIKGTNFRTDIGYTVYFGNERATSVTIINDSEILATTPMMDEPTTVDVFVSADNGPAFKIAQAFRFEAGADQAGAPGAEDRGNLAF